jgi:hypothetical protein
MVADVRGIAYDKINFSIRRAFREIVIYYFDVMSIPELAGGMGDHGIDLEPLSRYYVSWIGLTRNG